MPLNLKELSPFVTHLVCFFLGMALALMKESQRGQGAFVPSKVYFPVKTSKFIDYPKIKIRNVQKFIVAKKQDKSKHKLCSISHRVFEIYLDQGYYSIRLNPKDVSKYFYILQDSFYLISLDEGRFLPLCQQNPEVSYGSES